MTFVAGQVLTAAQLNALDITSLTVDTDTLVVDATNDRVGINTASPSVALDVGGSVVIDDDLTVDTSTLKVDSTNNRVGIGTASPVTTLGVDGDLDMVGTARKIVFGRQDEGGPHGLEAYYLGAMEGALYYRTSPNSWSFEDGSGTKIAEFDTDDARTTFGGNVGIKTTNPESILHLNPGTNLTPDANGVGHIMIDGSGYTSFFTMDGTGTWIGNNSSSRSMILATNETARLTVLGGGNVGIGTTSPDTKLEIETATGTNPSTPTEIRISTSTNGGSWSTTNPWGRLSFWSADTSNGGAKIHAAIATTAVESFGGMSALQFFVHDGSSLRRNMTIPNAGDLRLQREGVVLEASGKSYWSQSPPTGTGNDAEWTAAFGYYYLRRNSSVAADKVNIQTDLGTHLTADMIDSVVPKMWARTETPDYPEIGPIADDMDLISPFLVTRGTDANGDVFMNGIDRNAYLSLLVLAVKDLRARVATLEAA